MDDVDLYRERVQATATGILTLLGIDADPVASREHILVSRLLDHAWQAGAELDIEGLIGAIHTALILDLHGRSRERFEQPSQPVGGPTGSDQRAVAPNDPALHGNWELLVDVFQPDPSTHGAHHLRRSDRGVEDMLDAIDLIEERVSDRLEDSQVSGEKVVPEHSCWQLMEQPVVVSTHRTTTRWVPDRKIDRGWRRTVSIA